MSRLFVTQWSFHGFLPRWTWVAQFVRRWDSRLSFTFMKTVKFTELNNINMYYASRLKFYVNKLSISWWDANIFKTYEGKQSVKKDYYMIQNYFCIKLSSALNTGRRKYWKRICSLLIFNSSNLQRLWGHYITVFSFPF